MKLWLLRPNDDLTVGDNPWKPWRDKAFGFVVRAETEREARLAAHAEAGEENESKKISEPNSAWLNSKYSTCTELLVDGEPGVIIRDFKAS